MISFSKKKQRSPWLMYILLALAMLPIAIVIGSLVGDMYSMLVTINQEGALLALGFMLISLMIFLFGIFYVMNIFYFANDIETLLPLPFQPSQILGAKFTTVVLYEYLVAAIMYIPLIAVFGIKSGSGIIYYIYAIALFLVLPIIPLILASILVMIIMRFTNIAKNKDRMRIIGGIIAILLAVGANLGIQMSSRNSMDPNQLQSLFLEQNGFISVITKWFPTSKFPAEALLHWNSLGGFANIALFVGISGIALLLFLLLGEAIYFKGVTGVSETTAKRKTYSETELTTLTKQTSPLISSLLKEFRFLFRTPAYFMNCILSSFMMPIILVVVLFVNQNGIGQLRYMMSLMDNQNMNMGFVMAIVFVISAFLGSSNSIAATAISREGKNVFTTKYLPIPYKTQLLAKLLSGIILSLLMMAIVLIMVVVLIHPPVSFVIYSAIVMILGVIFSSLIGLIFDLYFPKLDWVNEQKAVKGNMNSLFSLLISIVIAGLVVFIFSQFDLGQVAGFMTLLVLLIVINLLLMKLLMSKGVRLFSEIEE